MTKLKKYIKSSGLKQNFIAKKVGMNYLRFCRLVEGRGKMTAAELMLLSKFFDVHPEMIYNDEHQKFEKA